MVILDKFPLLLLMWNRSKRIRCQLVWTSGSIISRRNNWSQLILLATTKQNLMNSLGKILNWQDLIWMHLRTKSINTWMTKSNHHRQAHCKLNQTTVITIRLLPNNHWLLLLRIITIEIKREKQSWIEKKKRKLKKSNSELEAPTWKETNGGWKMDFTRVNSVGSVYIAKAILTTRTPTNVRFDWLMNY